MLKPGTAQFRLKKTFPVAKNWQIAEIIIKALKNFDFLVFLS
jgi:hypothetical protein